MYIFIKFIYNEYIGPYILSHVVLQFLPVNPLRYYVNINILFDCFCLGMKLLCWNQYAFITLWFCRWKDLGIIVFD